MAGRRFTGRLEAGRGGGAFIQLPAEVVAGLGGGSRFRVTGTLNGVPLVSSTMPMGEGRVCLGVHKATRSSAGVEVGDKVEVELALDTAPREVHVPAELAAALAADPAASGAFDKLSFTRRREHAEAVANARRADTKARRIAQILRELRASR